MNLLAALEVSDGLGFRLTCLSITRVRSTNSCSLACWGSWHVVITLLGLLLVAGEKWASVRKRDGASKSCCNSLEIRLTRVNLSFFFDASFMIFFCAWASRLRTSAALSIHALWALRAIILVESWEVSFIVFNCHCRLHLFYCILSFFFSIKIVNKNCDLLWLLMFVHRNQRVYYLNAVKHLVKI
jgi:hypothetical protein